MEEEIWKDVVGYEGFYEVSNKGRVRNKLIGNILSQREKKVDGKPAGYLTVHLAYRRIYGRPKHRLVHGLVLEAFTRLRTQGEQIHHIDGDKKNNNLENLMYCDMAFNIQEDFRTGRRNFKGEQHNQSVLTEEAVLGIVSLRKNQGHSIKAIAEIYGMSVGAVYAIFYGDSWSHITNIKRDSKRCIHTAKI